MSMALTGILYFKSKLSGEELRDISFFIAEEAAKHRLGILLGGNLPPDVNEKFLNFHGVIPSVRGDSLIFNLSESAYDRNCDTLFEPIWIDSTNPSNVKVDVSKSALPRIQHFFEVITEREEILEIRLDMETAYDSASGFAHRECYPDQICETIRQEIARTMRWDPSVQIIIKKHLQSIRGGQ